jgi:cytochrome c oxidase cbb3-type subunit 3
MTGEATRTSPCAAALIALAALLALAACEREERRFREAPLPHPAGAAQSELRPGGGTLLAGGPSDHGAAPSAANPYQDSAWALSEGKQLYTWFNCVGCHAHGGGGMGPALMDDVWLYGSAPDQIFATIVEGRPNGMPSFRGKLSDQQVWQLVTYVRALSGQARLDVASSRGDHMTVKPAELSMPDQQPHDVQAPR